MCEGCVCEYAIHYPPPTFSIQAADIAFAAILTTQRRLRFTICFYV